jgi:integrase
MRESNKLTPLKVSRLTKPGRYADGHGLYLQISKWHTKSWVLRYMLDGHARHMGLGDINTFSLKEARERARAQRQLLADKVDPLAERNKARGAAQLDAARSVTFRDAAEQYIKSHAAGWKKGGKHGSQWANTLATYAYPHLGSLPVAAIDTALVMKVLDPIWTTRTVTANRVRGRIESVLDWAAVRGYRSRETTNPARWRGHLDKLLPAKSRVAKVAHHPAMPWSDVPAFMAELRSDSSIQARALELTVLTAVRSGDSLNAKWSEIDLGAAVWTVPPSRTKSGRAHRVPLGDRALEILKGLPRQQGNPHVFPGTVVGRPLGGMALLDLLNAMRSGLTVHGFRSSFRDWAAEASPYPREIAEAALGHALRDKTEAAYQRGDLLEKRRRMMEAWEGYCARPPGDGKVLPLTKTKVAM